MKEVEVPPTLKAEERAFEFDAGLFGFPSDKRFIIMDIPGGGDIFKQMVCLDRPEVGFTLVNPFAFYADYTPEIPDEEAQEIGASSPEQLVLMTIAIVPEKQFKESTTNLKAPLIFNPHTRKARQVILADERYSTRHRLFQVK